MRFALSDDRLFYLSNDGERGENRPAPGRATFATPDRSASTTSSAKGNQKFL